MNCPQVRHIKTNLFSTLADEGKSKKELINMARSTRPFLSRSVWNVLETFMDFMRKLPGEESENYRKVYENFSPPDLVKRLLFKRPIVFCGFTLMRNLENPTNDYLSFDDVAKNLEKTQGELPYLREYISWDEILLSSLINMSTPTFYVSDGSIKNWNEVPKNPFIDQGVLCGLVGARNTKYNYLEHRFVFPRSRPRWPDCTDDAHKSDQFWVDFVYPEAFPEGRIPTIDEIQQNPAIYKKIYVDGINVVYLEKRLMLSIISYIEEAVARGVEGKKNIFCSVPPIGAGVWAGSVPPDTIHRLIIQGVVKYFDQNYDHAKFHCLKALALPSTDLKFYKSLVKSSFDKISEISINNQESIWLHFKNVKHKIKIFNEIRFVAALLPEGFEDCLSVAGYAWVKEFI